MHLFGRGSVVVLFSAFCLVSASRGDRNWHYKGCLSTCDTERCATGIFEATKPLSLRLTGWTCLDDCKYDCMHKITSNNIASGQKIHQYYGKWPFWRFAGMQEPASVIFSMLNFLAHAAGLLKVRKRISASHPMRPFYVGWAYFSMNAWFWSSVFHTRDLPITEKFDYFSAALVILNALYGTVIRIFQLYPHPERSKITASPRAPSSTPTWKTLGGVCVLIYAAHIYYLTSGPRFDYTYNTIFNLVLGLSHNILWTLYALPSSMSTLKSRFPNSPRNYRPPFVNKAGLFVLLTTLATTLELFDFPPWARTIDAHALWHAATAPLAYFWYDFLIQDASDPSWNAPLLRQRPE